MVYLHSGNRSFVDLQTMGQQTESPDPPFRPGENERIKQATKHLKLLALGTFPVEFGWTTDTKPVL